MNDDDAVLRSVNGEGRLVSLQWPRREWRVAFRFQIQTTTINRPGFPQVAALGETTGRVEDLAGDLLPEGDYDLYADDGTVLRVSNVGMNEWAIVPAV